MLAHHETENSVGEGYSTRNENITVILDCNNLTILTTTIHLYKFELTTET